MAKISENVVGFNQSHVRPVGSSRSAAPFRIGTRVQCDDGTYQWAQAAAAITAGLATVLVNQTNFTAAATGGTAVNASGVALATGDQAWFKIAS